MAFRTTNQSNASLHEQCGVVILSQRRVLVSTSRGKGIRMRSMLWVLLVALAPACGGDDESSGGGGKGGASGGSGGSNGGSGGTGGSAGALPLLVSALSDCASVTTAC